MLRYLTAGESHGKAIVGILEGMPANLSISPEDINKELKKRQQGYGRGGRMKIETDKVEIISGIRLGKTLGSPISFSIINRDYENWKKIMPIELERNMFQEPVTQLRPGHADLTGCTKYNQQDIRNILERASARSTAALVAVGAVAKKLLSDLGVVIFSHVIQIGSAKASIKTGEDCREIRKRAEKSDVRCADQKAEIQMKKEINAAKDSGDSVGGVFEVITLNAPIGLGSHVHNDRRLDGILAKSVMSINGVKGVEIGNGFSLAATPGSKAHDEIFYERNKYVRHTNNAGGLEGGITNGEPIVVRAVVKPVATIKKSLNSVDLATKETVKAHFERADICYAPSAGVIAEAMVAIDVANALLEKFGGDSIEEIKARYSA